MGADPVDEDPDPHASATDEQADAPASPTDEEVVQTAAEAAEGVIFTHYRQSDVRDLDVAVTFDEAVLDVDVYLNVPEDVDPPAAEVADEAALAARDAVDDLFDAEV